MRLKDETGLKNGRAESRVSIPEGAIEGAKKQCRRPSPSCVSIPEGAIEGDGCKTLA